MNKWEERPYLLETGTNLLAQDQLEWELLLANDVDRREATLRNGGNKLHTDERRPNDDQTLTRLCS